MFTGIVQSVGTLAARAEIGGDQRLRFDAPGIDLSAASLGDSIAVSGVCLTAIELHEAGFSADVSGETLACTTLGALDIGHPVNLETALTLNTPLGGHLVSGHVDGAGELISRVPDARSERLRFTVATELARYIAAKGSVCIDGVSLTVNAVEHREFDVNIVPHTLMHTTMGGFEPGRLVNIEVDLIARYVERLAQFGSTAS